jgi:hypothetical protein
MRRLIFGMIALSMAILPAIAQDQYRLQRAPGQPASTDWVNDFSDAPAPANAAPNGSAGFVMNINGDTSRRPAPELPFALPPTVQRGVDQFVKKLGTRELSLLSSRDVIILLDKSSSMGDKDCPAPQTGLRLFSRMGEETPDVSRWDWCEAELLDMSRMAGGALRQGLRLVLFSSDQNVYDRVRLNEIPRVFQENYPGGSTNEAAALKAQLDWYFQNKAAGRTRPVVIAVITDGLPNNARALKKAIIDATHAMDRPDEVAITFLQVGRDRHGVNLVHEMDDDLVRQGAVFDIVASKDFGQLLQEGLGKALADAINESSRGVARRY